MPFIDRFPPWFPGGSLPSLAQTKNWRLWVFSSVFFVLAAGGLVYNYTRSAEYRAGARVEIVPGEKLPGEPNAPVVLSSGPDGPFLTEVQLLTARASLEEVATRMARAGFGGTLAGSDPVMGLQKMLSTEPVSGTQVVQLWAVGETPEVLPFLLNELISIYQTKLGERFVDSSTNALEQTRDETERYKTAILKLRGDLEGFRNRYGIVSKERDENEATARAKGLNTALNAAEEKAIAAQSKLGSLRAAIAAGKGATRAKDNPTLASLEQRLSQAREDLKQLERRYTAAYLARERDAMVLKTKIPELEQQIKREREASQQANLADAEQEVAQTQEALTSLRRQVSGEKHNVQSFSARLAEYGALQTQLERLEKLHDAASERLVKIEAREGARQPKLRVIQSASVPREHWRPNYHRDAAIVIVGALVLGWLAASLADFLVRRESGPTVIVAPTPIPYPIGVPELAQQATPILGAPAAAQLSPPRNLPRELEQTELTAMFESADLETRVALCALLCGVSPEELIALTWNDLDCQANTLTIARPDARTIQIAPKAMGVFMTLKQQRSAQAAHLLLGDAGRHSLPLSHLEALISYAAHDAGLQQAADVTPWAVRHTFISYLVRQGLRFSDLARIVGTLPAEVTAAYGALLPAGARHSLDQTDRVIPALRQFADTLDNDTARADS
jgi:uncharacterized protein involved in exopolysaccharide biosynthesis